MITVTAVIIPLPKFSTVQKAKKKTEKEREKEKARREDENRKDRVRVLLATLENSNKLF